MTTAKTTAGKFEGGAEVASNWFKFDAVGDGIKGTIINQHIQKSTTEAYPDQLIVEIQNIEDGLSWNVGISVKKIGTIGRLQKCKVGEIIAIVFDSEGESAVKGGKPAKNLKVFTYGMDPEYGKGVEVEVENIPM